MAQEKWLVEDAKVIDVEMVRTLKVGLIGGKVDIVGHDEPGARVEIHSVSGKPLLVSVDGGTLEIDHPQLNWDNFLEVFRNFRDHAEADVSIMVPRDVQLKFGTVSANALISGLSEDATLSTVSGDLTIDGHQGKLTFNAVSGEIAVRNQSGDVFANTVSGDITASGEILKFTSNGVSGEVFLDLAGTPDEIRVNTVSGDVTTRLAAGVPVRYKINTVGGRLQLDDAAISGVRGSYTSKYGALDKSWLDFRASTVNGNVSVVHAAHA